MPSLPIARAGRDAAVLLLLELVRRDLAQRAEQLGAELLVRVVAQVQLLDVDAGELVLALLEVVEGVARDVGLDRHVASTAPRRRPRSRAGGSCAGDSSSTRPRRRKSGAARLGSAGIGGTATGAARLRRARRAGGARGARRCRASGAPRSRRRRSSERSWSAAARRARSDARARRAVGVGDLRARPPAARSGRSGRPARRAS